MYKLRKMMPALARADIRDSALAYAISERQDAAFLPRGSNLQHSRGGQLSLMMGFASLLHKWPWLNITSLIPSRGRPYSGYSATVNAQSCRPNRQGLLRTPYCRHYFGRELGLVVAKTIFGRRLGHPVTDCMGHILRACYIFQIVCSWISAISVYMVNFMPWWTGANKSGGHKSMNKTALAFACFSEPHKWIAIPLTAYMRGEKICLSSHAARRGNAIDTFISWDGSPFFIHQKPPTITIVASGGRRCNH